jgi:hypothetical protein
MKTINATIARSALTFAIGRHEQQVRQWAEMADYDRAARYQAKADALAETLSRSEGAIARADVLLRIEQTMTMMHELSTSREYGKAARYQARATGLVELLEYEDAGTCGGYDTLRGQPSPHTVRAENRLRMRIDWLKSLRVAEPVAA